MKNLESFLRIFFQVEEVFFNNFDLNHRCKNKIEDKNENKGSRFSDTVSNKINFTAHGLYISIPPAWELNSATSDRWNNLRRHGF